MNSDQPNQFIYFEKQGKDMMCGCHCLNALLQGPYFDEVTLSNIALELDRKEQELMKESGTDNDDYLKYMQQESSNVADDGNYSVQVLSEALKSFGNITSEPLESPQVKASINDYTEENAYICHSVDHWLAIRKIDGVWYNLNSTNIVPPGPQIVSDFYLGAFLDSIMNSGYTIFVVRGQLPLPNKYQFKDQLRSNQMYLSVHEVKQQNDAQKNRQLNVSGADERELEEALQKSLKEYKEQNQDQEEDSAPGVGTILNKGAGQNQQQENKFEAFQGKGVSLADQSEDKQDDMHMYEQYGDDPELAYALKLSMMEEESKKLEVSNEPTDQDDQSEVVTIQLRMPDSSKLSRKFFYQDKMQDIMNYILKEKQQVGKKVKLISTGFPKKIFEDGSLTLKEAGIGKQENFIVELK